MVAPGSNASAIAVCQYGDNLASSGYSVKFSEAEARSDSRLYANTPIRGTNETSFYEGWEAGLTNYGNSTVTIKASALCNRYKIENTLRGSSQPIPKMAGYRHTSDRYLI